MPRFPRRKKAEAPAAKPDLRSELAALRIELQRLNSHGFIRIHNSFWRLLGYRFISGLAIGLGTVLGASILVSILGYFLSQIELVPIIGQWATQILEQIQRSVPSVDP